MVFDISAMTGEAIETIEEHLGGEPFIAWLERLARQFAQGVGVKTLRARDIIALIYLARSRTEPGLAWTDVSRTIAPYTLTVVDDEPAPEASAPPGPSPLRSALAGASGAPPAVTSGEPPAVTPLGVPITS